MCLGSKTCMGRRKIKKGSLWWLISHRRSNKNLSHRLKLSNWGGIVNTHPDRCRYIFTSQNCSEMFESSPYYWTKTGQALLLFFYFLRSRAKALWWISDAQPCSFLTPPLISTTFFKRPFSARFQHNIDNFVSSHIRLSSFHQSSSAAHFILLYSSHIT